MPTQHTLPTADTPSVNGRLARGQLHRLVRSWSSPTRIFWDSTRNHAEDRSRRRTKKSATSMGMLVGREDSACATAPAPRRRAVANNRLLTIVSRGVVIDHARSRSGRIDHVIRSDRCTAVSASTHTASRGTPAGRRSGISAADRGNEKHEMRCSDRMRPNETQDQLRRVRERMGRSGDIEHLRR